MKRSIYGSKSERFVPSNSSSQISLELEVESPTVIVPPAITTVPYQRKRKLQHLCYIREGDLFLLICQELK
ncbi:MAG: hypothetical protein IPL74_01175 [Bacteroidetes bacterium]|nr:hypothetical protein [Bacteroidota bacterium]